MGSDLLSDAPRRIALASQTILSYAEFIEFTEDNQILFLPMETLVATFSHIGAFEE